MSASRRTAYSNEPDGTQRLLPKSRTSSPAQIFRPAKQIRGSDPRAQRVKPRAAGGSIKPIGPDEASCRRMGERMHRCRGARRQRVPPGAGGPRRGYASSAASWLWRSPRPNLTRRWQHDRARAAALARDERRAHARASSRTGCRRASARTSRLERGAHARGTGERAGFEGAERYCPGGLWRSRGAGRPGWTRWPRSSAAPGVARSARASSPLRSDGPLVPDQRACRAPSAPQGPRSPPRGDGPLARDQRARRAQRLS